MERTAKSEAREVSRSVTIKVIAITFVLILVSTPSAQAQAFTILHSFTGGADGATPMAGVIRDGAGNLYGTASAGGAGYGTAYKLAQRGSGWVFTPLYSFQGGTDGAQPMGALAFGPDGSLYGATYAGGTPGACYPLSGCGTVFNLKPRPSRPSSVFSPWVETVLHRFNLGYGDGVLPYSEVTFDAAGNLYGTASASGGGACDGVNCGGCDFCGIVYKMMPSGGSWTYSVFQRFLNWDNGATPIAGLVTDQAGNLYGANSTGGLCGYGMLFRVPALQNLYTFCGYQGDGADPSGSLIIDASGTIYGGTPGALPGYGTAKGSIFSLTSGTWIFTVLHNFDDGAGPTAALTMDAAGNLYGSTFYGGNTLDSCAPYGCGTVFKLAPSGGEWIYTELYRFSGSDGQNPNSKVIIDSNGNLYGTASAGGASSKGVVWEITP